MNPEREALIWRGEENSKIGVGELRPGDTVVVRSKEGGCDRFGWNPGCEDATRDIGDLCANARAAEGGGRYRIRIHPMVVFPGVKERQDELRDAIRRGVDDDTADEVEAMVSSVPELAEAGKYVAWGRAKAYTDDGLLVVSKKFGVKEKAERPEPRDVDETDENDTGSLTAHMTLTRHTAGVVKKARKFSQGCGLEGQLEGAITTAAERHDLGKCDERFQRLLDPLWDASSEFLAKNDGCSPREYLKRQRESGYPKGARHEFASAALAEAGACWPEDCDPELVLHLIGTHHGYGRALPPIWPDDDFEVRAHVNGQEITVLGAHRVGQLDSGWTERYWALTRKYGWWGLAYLEAILRRADCVRSREEQEKG
jgi:CRISPR-associated endonuclease/helicase Cas3